MFQKTVKHFDMFAAAPLLRVKGEPETTNLCGGVFSILVLIGFTYVFITTTINVVTLQDIEATQSMSVKGFNLFSSNEIKKKYYKASFSQLALKILISIMW